MLFIDLDDVKTINDGLGHHAGDAVIRAAAQWLRTTMRADDFTASIDVVEVGTSRRRPAAEILRAADVAMYKAKTRSAATYYADYAQSAERA